MSQRNTTLRNKHRAIIARGEPPCWLCGEPINYTLVYPDPDCFVIDHVDALARGGTDTLDNLRAAHRRCNSAKSAREHSPIIRRASILNRAAAPTPR